MHTRRLDIDRARIGPLDKTRQGQTLGRVRTLDGIVLTQIVRTGAPVLYGGFTSNVDMRSGSPAFGTAHTMAR